MQHRTGRAVVVLVVVVVTGTLAAVACDGQSSSEVAPQAWAPTRTAWGDPDLQGVWNFNSKTPFERPMDGKAGYVPPPDPEAAVRDHAYTWLGDKTPNRESTRPSQIIDPPDGRLPALTSEAHARVAALAKVRQGLTEDVPPPGRWVDDSAPRGASIRCLIGPNSGPPMVSQGYNENMQLFQAPGTVVIFNEMNHSARIIPLDGRPRPGFRRWTGESRGHWDGQTLVVDTINFRDQVTNFVYFTFRTHGGKTHLVERFTRVDADTLRYDFTVDDPATYTRPFTAQTHMGRIQDLIYEYACHEGNYSLYNMLSGVRAQERGTITAAK